jgi:hypothetical protein
VAGKARRTFVGTSPERKLYTTNFGERWRELRVATRENGCTSEISVSRATPSYISLGFEIFGKTRYFILL